MNDDGTLKDKFCPKILVEYVKCIFVWHVFKNSISSNTAAGGRVVCKNTLKRQADKQRNKTHQRFNILYYLTIFLLASNHNDPRSHDMTLNLLQSSCLMATQISHNFCPISEGPFILDSRAALGTEKSVRRAQKRRALSPLRRNQVVA